MVETHLTGAFPRSEKLVAATRAFERGKATESEVEANLREDNLSLVGLQEESALDFFVDGQLNWQDLFRPFSDLFTGIELGSLTRWFDNNTFYRAPVVSGKIKFKGDKPGKFFRADTLPRNGRKKAVLPGPFTFAALSETNASLPDVVDEFSHALRDLIRKLQAMGYTCFQLNEPCLCAKNRTADDFSIAKNGIETCVRGLTGKSILHTYFADSSKIIDSLLDNSIDYVGIDFYATSLDTLVEPTFDKGLVCGCVDGRNSLIESPAEIGDFALKVRDKLEPRDLILAPNTDLDYLPQPIAEKKVRLLGKIRGLF
jgi:5-methyltetrahydropteroyltriglutamate--homocysteine methyltransferase